MRIKSVCRALGLLLALAFGHSVSHGQAGGPAPPEPGQLALRVRADGAAHVPGEPVTLKFTVLNNAGEPAVLPGGADVWRGHLRVFIARPGGDFKEYLGPRWGLRDVSGGALTIRPRGSYETEASVLYNHRPETAHLSEAYAAQARAGRVETEYALPAPGTYRVKAVLYLGESAAPVESEPTRVRVEAPRGDDLEVWNQIKGDAAFGYLIQSGDLPAHPDSPEARRVVERLESLAASYPDSRHARYIRAGLDRFRAAVNRLRAQGLLKQN
jgi:hypothetical protein